MAAEEVAHPSPAECRAKGREPRNRAPHLSHSGWQPGMDRPDQVALLQEDLTREPDLVPVRHSHMAVKASDDRASSPSPRQAAGSGCQLCRGRKTMTPAAPEGPVIEGLGSLEVRWILPGQLEPAVAGWFRRFPAEMASREDAYLLDPGLRGLSVKVRAGTALEVKVHRGSSGILDVAGCVRGRIESWQKWSFPLSSPSQDAGDLAGWRVISKRRLMARFSLAHGQAAVAIPEPTQELGCAVELTEVRAGGEIWWTLGFEATGPADLLHSGLQNTAVQIFAQAMPGDVELGMRDCQSYAQWLSRHREHG